VISADSVLILTIEHKMPSGHSSSVERISIPPCEDSQSVPLKREEAFLIGPNPFDIPCPVDPRNQFVALDTIHSRIRGQRPIGARTVLFDTRNLAPSRLDAKHHAAVRPKNQISIWVRAEGTKALASILKLKLEGHNPS